MDWIQELAWHKAGVSQAHTGSRGFSDFVQNSEQPQQGSWSSRQGLQRDTGTQLRHSAPETIHKVPPELSKG